MSHSVMEYLLPTSTACRRCQCKNHVLVEFPFPLKRDIGERPPTKEYHRLATPIWSRLGQNG